MQTSEVSHLTLRKSRPGDCALYYQWSQDSAVRANSYRNETFSFETHERWFNEKIRSDMNTMYVLESDGIPAGQIRFEIDNGSAEINFSIGMDFRGKGMGTKLLHMGSNRLLKDHPEINSIHGYVMIENESSKRAFIRAGFVLAGEECIQGRQSIKYVMTKHGWNSIKPA